MASNDPSRQVGAFRFRLSGILALRESLRWCFAWIMVWAVAVVGLRAIFRTDPLLLLWGSLGLAVAVAVGVALAMRQVPSARTVRAILDGHGSLGGLLMATEEADIGQWTQKIAERAAARAAMAAAAAGGLLLMSVSFLAAAFLAPDRYMPAADDALQVGGEMQKLTERIQVLKKEQILPPEKAQVMEKDLDRLRNEALGKDPAKTMEALDHLEQSLGKAAAEAAESAIKQAEKASRTQELAQALKAAQGQMDPKKFAEAMKELAQMAEQAAAEDKALADASPRTRRPWRQASFTAEQTREACAKR